MSYPIKASAKDEIKPGVFIETTAVLNESGELNISTQTWTTNLITGAHSRAVVYLFDEDGNRLWNTPELQCGIGGNLETLLPIFDSTVKSDRTENYYFSVPLDLASQAKYMRIVHSDRAKPFDEYLSILNRFFDTHKQPQNFTVYNDNGVTMHISGGYQQGFVVGNNNKIEKLTFTQNIDKESLAEAAEEIQKLLKQLELSNPTTTEVDKVTVAAKAAEEIKKNPMLKDRVIAALKSGGTEAFKEAVNHPLVNILVAIIEGWTQGE